MVVFVFKSNTVANNTMQLRELKMSHNQMAQHLLSLISQFLLVIVQPEACYSRLHIGKYHRYPS